MMMLEADVNPSSSETCLSVIGIHGLPGSGKTTLARHITEAAETSGYFDLVMWIHVSEKFSVDIILKEMFEQAWEGNGQCPQHNSLAVLKKRLKQLLTGKRFLLVLDDVWCSKEVNEQKKLPELLPSLIAANRGSKILVTSRQHDTLSELGPEVRVIDNAAIPELDDEVFFKLLLCNAFGQKDIDDVASYRRLLLIGAKIAQKLKKSPLLAIVVGQMLYKNHDVDHWESISEQKILEEYMGPLWWCYQHLDEQVKRCFAYCSVFPRRRQLYRDELVNLWVAEGFISTTKGGRDMQRVSQGYFNELLSISFLQPGGKNGMGKDSFVIHDLLYDLAEMVAGSECFKIENVWTKAPSNIRHLSIESCTALMITEDIVKLKNLRTLIIFHAEDDVSEYVLDKMFMELTKLRVLIFQTKRASPESGSLSFPRSINYLKHLRYLGVLITWIPKTYLPDTVAELYLLQVLDFGFGAYVEMPTGVDYTSLTNLRHVIAAGQVYFPNMGRLTSLQTIPTFNVSKGEGYELHQLSDLNDLRGDLNIKGLEVVDSKDKALQAKLTNKKRVKSLSLSWGLGTRSGDAHEDVLEALCPPDDLQYLKICAYGGSRYPSWMVGLQESTMDLHELHLVQCDKLVPAPAPELFFVRVTSLVLNNCNWVAMPYNMVYLTTLKLRNSSYKVMPDNLDQLTSLKRLMIIGCRYFDRFPALPTSLKYLELRDCSDEFASSCQTIGHPNYKAIEHIPDKVIYKNLFGQLIVVLDLQECPELGDDHLKYISNLLLLKYLSLGRAFTSLPKGIEKLRLLEVLDLRRTKVEVLPMEVILLPSLVHLFGKFKISEGKVKRMSELQNFLFTGQCKLETLAGFVTDERQGFPQIMSHMKKLRKVRIWCEKTASSTNLSHLQDAIQRFIHDEKEESHEPRSLSLHLDGHCCEAVLNTLKAPCYLSKLKINSKLLELPQFVKSLRGLRELSLSSTKLTTGLLEALTELRSLQYLKLIADRLEEFIIRNQAFPRLLRLCLVLQCPTVLKIDEGALPYLMSLQLIGKDLVGLADKEVKRLLCLKEVILDPSVTPETREAWEKAVKEHPNRPKVLLHKTTGPTESEDTEHSPGSERDERVTAEAHVDPEEPQQVVDTQMLVNEASGSSTMTKKRKYSAAQSSSNDELSSSLDDMGRCLLVPIDPDQ